MQPYGGCLEEYFLPNILKLNDFSEKCANGTQVAKCVHIRHFYVYEIKGTNKYIRRAWRNEKTQKNNAPFQLMFCFRLLAVASTGLGN
jgi:hypothetical protein